jgi:hypothetical protein
VAVAAKASKVVGGREDIAAELAAAVQRFRARADALDAESGGGYEWRMLAYDILRVYIRGQRAFLAVEHRILARVRADVAADASDRKRSLDLAAQLGELRDPLRVPGPACVR